MADKNYSLTFLTSAVALKLNRPVELRTVATYRGMAHEYAFRDGGTQSITFWHGVPPDSDTFNERCVFVDGGIGKPSKRYALAEAVQHIVNSPWMRVTEEW